MDQGELRLRHFDKFSDTNTDELSKNDLVTLYSEYYDHQLTVKITHSHGNEFGGDVVNISDKDPMIAERDIIHFKPEHIQCIEKQSAA